MNPQSILTKLTAAAVAVVLLNSCNKEVDPLTNNNVLRKDESSAQVIDYSTVSNDMVLEDRVNGVDYTITTNLVLNANLTIKPGVTIMFENGAGIQVNEEGSITAIGAVSNKILFTSKSGKRGDWKGITVLSTNAKNVFSYCKIEQGGGNGTANLTIGAADNTASAEISFSEITASKFAGVVIAKGSKVFGFAGNNIHTNTTFPMSLNLADAFAIESSNRFATNGKEFIELTGTETQMTTAPITISKCDEPYLVSGKSVIGNELKIAAGTKMYMNNNAEFVIDGKNGNGTFNAVGQPNQPITIAAIYNGTGVWNAIKFNSSDSNNNRIEYCNISGGGLSNGGFDGMISVVNPSGGASNIVVRNSTIMNSAASGIYIQSANSEYNSDIFTSNQYINCAKGNVHIE